MKRQSNNCNLKQVLNHVEVFHKLNENENLFAISKKHNLLVNAKIKDKIKKES